MTHSLPSRVCLAMDFIPTIADPYVLVSTFATVPLPRNLFNLKQPLTLVLSLAPIFAWCLLPLSPFSEDCPSLLLLPCLLMPNCTRHCHGHGSTSYCCHCCSVATTMAQLLSNLATGTTITKLDLINTSIATALAWL
jgi:hypothetical protein